MTHALCVYCGSMKFGALVTCNNCGASPRGQRAFAYSMVLTEWHVPVETLREISREMTEEGLPLPSLTPEQEQWAIATYAAKMSDG